VQRFTDSPPRKTHPRSPSATERYLESVLSSRAICPRSGLLDCRSPNGLAERTRAQREWSQDAQLELQLVVDTRVCGQEEEERLEDTARCLVHSSGSADTLARSDDPRFPALRHTHAVSAQFCLRTLKIVGCRPRILRCYLTTVFARIRSSDYDGKCLLSSGARIIHQASLRNGICSEICSPTSLALWNTWCVGMQDPFFQIARQQQALPNKQVIGLPG